MKRLAERFKVRETTHQRETLVIRLVPDPIHRYADQKVGLVDGCLFIFAHGHNPEALLVIECVEEGEATRWEFGMAPMTTLKLSATVSKEELWRRGFGRRPWQQTTYTYGRADRIPQAEDADEP